MTFPTIGVLKNANAASGGNWFSPATIRFFNSRIPRNDTRLIHGRYFVSSEQFDHDAPRLYTIREALSDASVETIGEFQGYVSADAARRAAQQLPAECSAYLLHVIESREWIETPEKLAEHTGKPLKDCRTAFKFAAV